MKVEQSTKVAENVYPVLKIHSSGFIILFTGENTGTVIDPFKSEHKIGTNGGCWAEAEFSIFHGRLVLSNDD